MSNLIQISPNFGKNSGFSAKKKVFYLKKMNKNQKKHIIKKNLENYVLGSNIDVMAKLLHTYI